MNATKNWEDEVLAGKLEANRHRVKEYLEYAKAGRLRVPSFQRPLRWSPKDEARLFDSILRRFPIGTLLLWQHPAKAAAVSFKRVVVPAPEMADALWVVDGQQRLNTIVGLLLNPPPPTEGAHRELFLNLSDGQFRWLRAEESAELLPVRRLADPVLLSDWRDLVKPSVAQHTLAVRVADRIQNYEIPTYTTQMEEDAHLRILFTRVNTSGAPMREAEVFHALHRASEGGAPADQALVDAATATSFGPLSEKTRQFILLAVSGRAPRSGVIRSLEVDALTPLVSDAARALQRAIHLLQAEMEVPVAAMLPGDLPLVVLTHLLHRFDFICERSVVLLTRWLWRGAAVASLTLTNEHLVAAFRAVQAAEHEEQAVQDLLALVPRAAPGELPRPGDFNARGVDARLALLWLASLRPEPLPASQLSLLTPLGAPEPAEDDPAPGRLGAKALRSSVGARLLVPLPRHRDLGDLLAEQPAAWLAGHALAEEDRPDLAAGRWDAVVERRLARIRAGVERMVRRGAAWDQDDDGPSIAFTISQVAG